MENLAATVDSDVSRNIELYDQSLQAVVKNLALPRARRCQQADAAV